jgi:hypothetical protein
MKLSLITHTLYKTRFRSFMAFEFGLRKGLSKSVAPRENNQCNLTFGLAGCIIGEKLDRVPAPVFLELLCQFSSHADTGCGSNLGEHRESLEQPVRRFEVDARFGAGDAAFQLGPPPPALHREKSTKEESVRGKSRPYKRGKNRARTGEDTDRESLLPTRADEANARIRYSWRPCICNKCDGFTFRDLLNQGGRANSFVMLMQAEQRLLDTMVQQEDQRMSRILSCDEVGFTQRLQGSQGDILQIPDRCRNDR